MTEDAQSHSGAVGGGMPTVGCAFADGSTGNTARRTSLTYPDGRIVAFGYGSAGSLDDVLSRVADVTIQGESQAAAAYTCAGAARYVKIASPEPGTELTYFAGPGQVTPGDSGDPYVGYDRFGRTVQMRWQVSGTGALRDGYQWGYDRASHRTWRRNLAATSGGQDEAYTYDGLHQVTGDQRGTLNLNQTGIGAVPATTEAFAYDPTGNWLRYATQADGAVTLDQSRTNNQANQLTQIDADSGGITYDGAGNMTSLRPGGTDGDDWDENRSLTWDAWNRLVAVADEEETVVATYAYDALTRRIVRTVGTEDPVHTYWSDQWKPLEERVGADTDPERQYVWGARPRHRDELILRDRDTTGDGDLDERLYATMDYFNATGALDADGDVVERYAYSAFGVRRVKAPDFTPRSASTVDWVFAFQGQFLDPETGYYDYGYRFYVPLLGRWINRDPIIEAGSRNVYDFTFNTAINTIDYLGLDGKANCESVKTRALAWDFVKNLMKTPIQKLLEKGYSRENAKDLTQGGNNACLTGIECVESDSGVGGMYFHDTGTIKLNCCVGGKSRTSEEISQSLQHELSHAESMCRKPLADCDACMKEEMKAYWRAGECTSTAECAERAINSCKFGRRPHCGNKSVGQLLSNAAAGQYNPDQPYLPIPRNS
ncbi:MAG: RHS repeat-associated core domain-containing protein [Verrucomicrobiales bacterium]